MLLDRTAVLVVGLVAGFIVGRAFIPETVPAPVAVAPPASAPTPVAIATPAAAARPDAVDPRVVARFRRDGVIRVGVFGDSIGIGIHEALYRTLPAAEGYRVVDFAKQATGFTRYRQLDLEAEARRQLAAEPVDVAVISFGANDFFPLYEGKLYPLLSDGWRQVVGERIDRFVAAARSTGAPVFWIGLPVLRDPAKDAEARAMNAFFQQRLAPLGVPFVDTRPLTSDAQGRYSAYLPDAKTGEPRLMRTGDGMHMIGVGYQRISASTAERIRAYAARVREAAR